MAQRYDLYRRLEPDPRARTFAAGFAATLHDPLWFLARQWQLGEHQGENATTPVLVNLTAAHTPIRPEPASPDRDPASVPAESIIEGEPDEWWTTGRRIRVGAVVAAQQDLDPATVDPKYLLASPPPPYSANTDRQLPPPYERLAGGFDGYALWRDRAELGMGDTAFTGLGIPTPSTNYWQSDELVYETGFPLGNSSSDRILQLPRHRGGRVDWFSADAEGTQTSAVVPPEPEEPSITCYPTSLQYPGAPRARWWEIEDAAVDIGGYPPDTSHFATTLLIDLIASHSDDWFMFPVPARVGHVVTLLRPTVIDSFGQPHDLAPPKSWSLFRTTGLDDHSLVMWLRALTPIEGPAIEDVLLGLDEYSNILWAIERKVSGHTLAPPERTREQEALNPTLALPDRGGAPGGRQRFAYVPGRDLAPYWHPYQVEDLPGPDGVPRRRFVQRRLADLARTQPELMPAPTTELLRAQVAGTETIHQIAPSTVPSIGMVFERRYVLARDVTGQPLLWREHRRAPSLHPPGTTMRFDVLAEDTHTQPIR
ncbi:MULTISPECIES: hypothetical protein [Streptomyces]|uniref:Uncharacterized protein n=1 Tax=Streptomyces chartreusis NRRL 3882 TaxID=1079985 RepID=A0A2N9AZW5_STRCX|nr:MULTISPECIES: hypothetical protein [Streptomyces]MYS95587.1 hypothetical protein [Streptomyces sp. SID5464]SOR76611.1 hypothetical protein SCNRRL3882_0094 [Streptomyces chartreusis NRRL 3882]